MHRSHQSLAMETRVKIPLAFEKAFLTGGNRLFTAL